MSIKNVIRRIALAVISEPKHHVVVDVNTINYGSILNGKNFVVTGGSKGIGFAIAKKIISEGGRVLITGRNLENLKNATGQLGSQSRFIQFDNSEVSSVGHLLEESRRALGKIDGLVLNAGISFHEGNFLNVTLSGFDKQFDINLKANYFLAQAFIKYKIETNETGDILFLSSETAGKSVDIPYGLTKAAINSLVGGLARRVYHKGIRVNAIAPGVTLTNMTSDKTDEKDDLANDSAAGRFILPSEIAEIACFMLSNASKCISGEVIYCDAGSHLKINGTESEYSL